jgi:hypothetical protein
MALVLFLVVITLAVYFPVVHNGFVTFDDDKEIYNNPQIQQGLTRETLRWALTTTENANWYPLRRLSHLVDVSIFGLWAGGHHLVSAGWHAAAAGVLLVALWSMTGALWRSLTTASLFALHPLQVESVAWATERSNVLSGVFFALTLLLWIAYVRRPGVGRYAATLLVFTFGCMAKPNLMPLPFLLLLLDAWPFGRLTRFGGRPVKPDRAFVCRRVLEKVPFLAIAAVAGAVAVLAHRQANALSLMEKLTLKTRLANAVISAVRYMGKLLWPHDLAVYYPYPLGDLPLGPALAAGFVLAAVTGLAIARWRTWPWLLVGWLWFLGMLAPMIGIVQFGQHSMADRFAYLAAIGVFIGLAWSVRAPLTPGKSVGSLIGVAAAATLLACSLLTVRQIGRWKDTLTLYEHTLSVTKDNRLIEFNLANELWRRGRRDEALEHYSRAIRIFPEPDALNNLGAALIEMGKHGEALGYLREAARQRPENPDIHWNLLLSLKGIGRHEEAASLEREWERLQSRR